jgi:hypothetical protein
MSQLVDLELDRHRQIRFGLFDARDACRYLSNVPGKGKVDSLELLMMLARRDLDAFAAVLSEGLKHEEPGIRPDRALRYLVDYLDQSKDKADKAERWSQVAKAIRKAGEIGGVWDAPEEGDDEAASSGNVRPSTVSRPLT